MGIISWIIFGIIAGALASALARFIRAGQNSMGIFVTMILGIVGAVVGGWISTLFGLGTVDGFNISSFIIAVVGALLVLFIWGLITRKKQTT